MSYIEIYNEKVKDLLSQTNKPVREMAREGFFVEGLEEVPVTNQDDFQRTFKKGTLARFTKQTNMNLFSSRSHAILTITVEVKQIINGDVVIKTSKINFVDLAGS